MYSDYFERDIEIDSGDKETLLDIYEAVAKQQGFTSDYDDRELVDFEEDTALLDTVLYHVAEFGKGHPRFGEIAGVFEGDLIDKDAEIYQEEQKMGLGKNIRRLLEVIDGSLVVNHGMTTDEMLECLHCGVDEDGEIIDLDTGNATGVYYDDIEYDVFEDEVEISVENVEWADTGYLEGILVVDGEKYPFDYHLETEAVDVHCYSEPGWMTGASYEKPLPEVVTEHMEEVLGAVSDAVDAFLEGNGYAKLSGNTVDELVSNAGMAARDANASKGAKVLSFVDEIGYTQFSVDAGWYEKQENKEDIESLFEKATYDEIGSRFKDLTGKYWEPELDM